MIYGIIFLFIVVLIIFMVKSFFSIENGDRPLSSLYTSEQEFNEALENTEEFDKNYFKRIQSGESSQEFLNLASQQDCALIRSLLAAANIPTYIKDENINRMYGGIATPINAIFSIKLYILISDYDDAYKIICDYAEQKKNNFNSSEIKKTASDTIKTVSEAVLTGLFFSATPLSVSQKALGITVLPKIAL